LAARRSRRDRLALIVWLVAIGAIVVGLLLWWRSGFGDPGFIYFVGPVPMLAYALAATTQTTAGLILAVRRPANAEGWLTLAFGLDLAIGGLIFGFLPWARHLGIAADLQAWAAWLTTWLTLPLGTLISVWIGLIFPAGRFISPRWRAGFAVAVLGAVAAAVTLALSPGPLVLYPGVTNPLTGEGHRLDLALAVSLALFVASAPVTGLTLSRRYADADAVGRLQIRWFVTFSFVLEAAFVAFLASLVLLPPEDPLGWLIVSALSLSTALPAVALVIAILRYRLYNIDTIISRTFVYGALTAILAGIYAASFQVIQALFVTMTGETSDVALVVTTLLLVTSFTPLKSRLERFVERRYGQVAAVRPGAARAILDDPAFAAELDARIAAALARGRKA
jgi:hypothetical protein